MLDMERMSDEELRKIAGEPENLNLESLSDEELRQIAGEYAPGAEIKPQDGHLVGPAAMYQGMGESALAGLTGGLQGLADITAGIGSLPARGYAALTGKEFKPATVDIGQVIPGTEQLMAQHPIATAVGEIAGGTAPALLIGQPELALAGRTTQALRALGAGKRVSNILGRAVAASGTGAVLGPAYEIDKPFAEGVKEGVEGSLFGEFALKPLTEKLTNAIANSPNNILGYIAKKVGGTDTPEQMKYNLQAAKDIGVDDNITIGEIATSPHLKTTNAILSSIPGTGRAQENQKIGKAIDETVLNYINDTSLPKGVSRTDAQNAFINEIKKKQLDVSKESSSKYNDVIKAAREGNVKFNKNELYNVGEEIKNSIKGKSLEDDEDLKEIISKIYQRETSPIFGTRLKTQKDFKEGFDLQKLINEKINDLPFEGQQNKKRLLTKAKNAIESDLQNSGSQSEAVFNKLKEADKFYVDEVLPLNQRDIRKFTTGKADPDTFINSFLKVDNRDELLNRIAKHLQPEQKEQFANLYLTKLSRNLGEKDQHKSGKILNTFAALPDNAKEQLFSPRNRKMLESANHVKQMMGGDLHQMLNPKTGLMGQKMAALATVGIPAIIPGIQLYQGGLSQENVEKALAEYIAIKSGRTAAGKFVKSPLFKDIVIATQKYAQKEPIKTKLPAGVGGALGIATKKQLEDLFYKKGVNN